MPLEVQLNVSRLDVRVKMPNGVKCKPTIAGFIDNSSGAILVVKIGTKGPELAREALAELLRVYGIPSVMEIGEGCDAAVMAALRQVCLENGGMMTPAQPPASTAKSN